MFGSTQNNPPTGFGFGTTTNQGTGSFGSGNTQGGLGGAFGQSSNVGGGGKSPSKSTIKSSADSSAFGGGSAFGQRPTTGTSFQFSSTYD